jgi:signal transduction histidine kinase
MSALQRDELHSETLAAMSALRAEINLSIRSRLDRIGTLETLQVGISISLALLALAAALERARVAALERSARAEAERRAREEAALREAAAAVASAHTVEETVRRIADSAVTSTGADAALVERVDADRELVEIVAKSGSCGPPLREPFDYDSSVSRRLVDLGGPAHWNSYPADTTLPLERYLGPCCDCVKVLAVPLRDPERALGSLIVLRGPDRRDFDDEEAERLRIFGGLAVLEFRRITSLAESERQRRELERVTESRSRLLRGFSHDVKNALGAADGYAQLLEEGVVGAPSIEQQLGIGHLRRSLDGAIKLAEDLLDLARVEAGQIQIDWREVDVRAVATHTAEAYRPQAEQKRIELIMDIDPHLPSVRSDSVRIQQVLGNLISNAIKYTPEGGHVRIVARAGHADSAPRAGPWAWLRVIDDGPGIPQEQQSSVFDEFVRLAPEAGPGSGVGLAISRRIARALRGEVTVRSNPDSGSEFTLWLPLGLASDRLPE